MSIEKRVEELRQLASAAPDTTTYAQRLGLAAVLAGFHTPEEQKAFAQGVRMGRLAAFADAADTLKLLAAETQRQLPK